MPVNFNQTFLKESMIEVEADPSPNQGGWGSAILRFVTRQLFRQFRSDQFISKISITVAVY